MSNPQFTRHVDRLFAEPQELFDAGEAIGTLTASPGWAVLSRVIGAELAELSERLDAGIKPLEHAEYALAHGRRGGLLAAHAAAEAVLERAAQRMQQQRDLYEGDGESSL